MPRWLHVAKNNPALVVFVIGWHALTEPANSNLSRRAYSCVGSGFFARGRTGKHMLERLRMGPGDGCEVGPFEVKDYPDTKIKLHFSHFKILVSGRRARLH